MKGLGIVAAVLLAALSAVHARDSGQWGEAVHDACMKPESAACSAALHIYNWFQGLMQPDNPFVSCCGEADAYEADNFEVEGDHYVAIITNGKGILPEGTRVPVPNQKMKWDAGNPTGHGILFLAYGPAHQVYCYVAPGGV